MSLRNRELANLVVVGALTALGFASVYIARQDVVSTASLSYALFFFALYLAAHLVGRLTVPFADPYLLPMAGLLTGVGLTEIYRLNPSDAFRQGLWIVVALGAFSATLFLLRHDYRRLESYKYLFGISAIVLLMLPALPGARHDRQRRAALDPRRLAPVPAGRAGEGLPDRLPRRLPAREARGAGAGTAEGLRAAAADLGRRDARARRDERPRLGAPLLRDLPRRCSTSRRAARSTSRIGARALPGRRVRRLPLRRPRPRPRHDLAAPVDRPRGLLPDQRQAAAAPGLRELPARQVALLGRRTGAGSAPASARAPSGRPAATR